MLLALGVLGFAALGPAAWQTSIRLVRAGSLFAWCQGAVMGGAAVSGSVASAAVGAGVAASTAIPKFVRRAIGEAR